MVYGKVYLAGPISGLTYDGAQSWRKVVTDTLAPDITCYSPLRQKHYLRSEGTLEQSYTCHELSTDRGIMTRDHWDCMTSDVVFANLLGATRISIGTVMELAWAFAYRKPLIVVMEPENNAHEHPMIREALGYRVDSLERGVEIARALLLPAS